MEAVLDATDVIKEKQKEINATKQRCAMYIILRILYDATGSEKIRKKLRKMDENEVMIPLYTMQKNGKTFNLYIQKLQGLIKGTYMHPHEYLTLYGPDEKLEKILPILDEFILSNAHTAYSYLSPVHKKNYKTLATLCKHKLGSLYYYNSYGNESFAIIII